MQGSVIRKLRLALLSLGFTAVHLGADAASVADNRAYAELNLQPTAGWAIPVVLPEDVIASKRIPVQTDWGQFDLDSSTVTFGLPLPRDLVTGTDQLRLLDASDRVVPAEFKTTATWDGPAGSPRWVLVQASLQRGEEYFIGYGDTLPDEQEAAAIWLEETADRLTVTTGGYRVTISKWTPSVIESLSVIGSGAGSGGSSVMMNAEQSAAYLPFILDDAGNRYTARRGGDFEVSVVHSGTRRVVIRREGWYADAANTRLCQFITYTYFDADSPVIRHDHTMVVAFDSHHTRIGGITLPLPMQTAGAGQVTVAADVGDEALLQLANPQLPLRLTQAEPNQWTLTAGDSEVAAGRRSAGWVETRNAGYGAVVALADFWQQAPGGLEVDDHMLQVHLWPPHNDSPLDFAPSVWLGDAYPGDHVFHGPWYGEGLDEMTQAYGLGKTHSIYLAFASDEWLSVARTQVQARAMEPVLAYVDPAWACASGVLYGRVHPHDPEQFPVIEGMIDSFIERYYAQREDHNQYGWIDFGDVYNTGNLWRRWASMFYGFPNTMPRLYLRSGRRDAWDFHRVNTRHITDIDICNLTEPAFDKVQGLRYGGNGGIAHYAADLYDVGCDTHLDFMLMDFYLNGNYRTWEVANNYLRAYADMRHDPGAMMSYQHRHTGGALRLFSEGYRATWDPEYLSIMRQVADILYGAYEELGITRHDDVYMNPGKVLYYQITGDELMREMFLDEMSQLAKKRNTHALEGSGRHATMSGLAHAYWMTGDERFLPFLLWQLNLPLEAGGPNNMRGVRIGVEATHALQLPEVMAVLAAVDVLPPAEGPAPPSQTPPRQFGITGNGPIQLYQPDDGSFFVELEVDLDAFPIGGFYNWDEWLANLDEEEQPALLVIDPAGTTIRTVQLNAENAREPITIELPADGKTGTYTIMPASQTVPLAVRLADTSLAKRVYQTGDGSWVSGNIRVRSFRNRTFYFTVPAGTEEFILRLKTSQMRTTLQCVVQDAGDNVVAFESWDVGASPTDEWQLFEIFAGAPKQDEVWSVTLNGTPPVILDFQGVPNAIAATPEALFVPAHTAAADQLGLAAFEPALTPWGGQATTADQPLTIDLIDHQAPLFNEESGTLEFWIRTLDPLSRLSDHTLLSSGSLRIFRRGRIGTYVLIGGSRFHRFFRLPTGRWTHIALTWQPSSEPGQTLELKLFADGVEVKERRIGGSESPHKNVTPNWSGTTLTIGAGNQISNLRISDAVLYDASFTRPAEPLDTNDDTRLLLPLDGSRNQEE